MIFSPALAILQFALLGLSVLVIVKGGAVLALAWMTLLSTLPVVALQIWFARREAPWARIDFSPIELAKVKPSFTHSICALHSAIGDMIPVSIEPVVIASFVGLAAVTRYRVASVFTTNYISLIVCAIGQDSAGFEPASMAHETKMVSTKFSFFATRVSLCMSIFVGFSLIFWGKPVISLLDGSQL